MAAERQPRNLPDVHVNAFPYRPAAIQFSAKILDVEHISNMRIL